MGRRIIKWTAVTAAVLVLAGAVAVALLDWDMFKDEIASVISERLGRQVTIQGDLDVELSLHPTVTAGDVRVANAPWAPAGPMARLRQVRVTLDLWDLVTGKFPLLSVYLDQPQLSLRRNDAGAANWRMGKPQQTQESETPSPLARLQRLTVEDGRVQYVDQQLGLNLTAQVSHVPAKRQERETLHVQGQGQLQGEAVEFSLTGASVTTLAAQREAYHLQGKAAVGDATATVAASLPQAPQLTGLEGQLQLQAPGLESFRVLLPGTVEDTPPIFLSATVGRPTPDRWRLGNLDARLGDSTLAGDVMLDTGGPKPSLYANLSSQRLQWQDLRALAGPQEAAERESLFPDQPLPMDALQRWEAEVNLQVQQLQAGPLPINGLQVDATLQQGRLRLQPLVMEVGGGRIQGHLSVASAVTPPQVSANLDVKAVQLDKLLPENELLGATGGYMGGQVRFEGSGPSVDRIMATADGKAVLMMSGGQVDNLLVEGLGLDVAEALLVIGAEQETAEDKESATPLRCAVLDVQLQQGVMGIQTLVADTRDSVITGDGRVLLGEEQWDLTLEAHPKDASLLAASAPVHIGGPLTKPDIDVDKSGIAGRAAAAVALGALFTPFAALLPLVEPGGAESPDCGKLLREAEQEERSAR